MSKPCELVSGSLMPSSPKSVRDLLGNTLPHRGTKRKAECSLAVKQGMGFENFLGHDTLPAISGKGSVLLSSINNKQEGLSVSPLFPSPAIPERNNVCAWHPYITSSQGHIHERRNRLRVALSEKALPLAEREACPCVPYVAAPYANFHKRSSDGKTNRDTGNEIERRKTKEVPEVRDLFSGACGA